VPVEDSDTRPPHVLPRSLCCSPASISPGPSPFLTPSTAVYSCTAVPCLKVTAEPATATSCAFGPASRRARPRLSADEKIRLYQPTTAGSPSYGRYDWTRSAARNTGLGATGPRPPQVTQPSRSPTVAVA
jgi:hypothetical protein